jgi:nuclear pore complex protein Nup98-Nup96
VAVYYSEDEAVQKPPVGSGLNKPCRVVLTGVHKKNKPQSDAAVISAFSAKLKRYCSNMGARFLSYEPTEGVWTFEVRGVAGEGGISISVAACE